MSARTRNRKGLQPGQLIGAANPAAMSNAIITGSNEITLTWSPPLLGDPTNFQIGFVWWNGGRQVSVSGSAPDGPSGTVLNTDSALASEVLMVWLESEGNMRTDTGARINSKPVIVTA